MHGVDDLDDGHGYQNYSSTQATEHKRICYFSRKSFTVCTSDEMAWLALSLGQASNHDLEEGGAPRRPNAVKTELGPVP